MEAFETFVAVALETEDLVVSEAGPKETTVSPSLRECSDVYRNAI
jgi:hypothetical protein